MEYPYTSHTSSGIFAAPSPPPPSPNNNYEQPPTPTGHHSTSLPGTEEAPTRLSISDVQPVFIALTPATVDRDNGAETVHDLGVPDGMNRFPPRRSNSPYMSASSLVASGANRRITDMNGNVIATVTPDGTAMAPDGTIITDPTQSVTIGTRSGDAKYGGGSTEFTRGQRIKRVLHGYPSRPPPPGATRPKQVYRTRYRLWKSLFAAGMLFFFVSFALDISIIAANQHEASEVCCIPENGCRTAAAAFSRDRLTINNGVCQDFLSDVFFLQDAINNCRRTAANYTIAPECMMKCMDKERHGMVMPWGWAVIIILATGLQLTFEIIDGVIMERFWRNGWTSNTPWMRVFDIASLILDVIGLVLTFVSVTQVLQDGLRISTIGDCNAQQLGLIDDKSLKRLAVASGIFQILGLVVFFIAFLVTLYLNKFVVKDWEARAKALATAGAEGAEVEEDENAGRWGAAPPVKIVRGVGRGVGTIGRGIGRGIVGVGEGIGRGVGAVGTAISDILPRPFSGNHNAPPPPIVPMGMPSASTAATAAAVGRNSFPHPNAAAGPPASWGASYPMPAESEMTPPPYAPQWGAGHRGIGGI